MDPFLHKDLHTVSKLNKLLKVSRTSAITTFHFPVYMCLFYLQEAVSCVMKVHFWLLPESHGKGQMAL